MNNRRRGRAELAAQPGVGSRSSPPGTGSGGRSEAVLDGGKEAALRSARAWPGWAKALVSLAIVYHMTAVLAGALGVPPSSLLERTVADLFTPYYDLVDFGYAYRFYTEPPPTPVVTATLQFGDERPEETVRLPGRKCVARGCATSGSLHSPTRFSWMCEKPRSEPASGSQSRLARAYARHLCATRPGCQSVTLHLQYHLIPEIDQVREATERPAAPRFDLFAESLFTTPEWIGEYPCDGL